MTVDARKTCFPEKKQLLGGIYVGIFVMLSLQYIIFRRVFLEAGLIFQCTEIHGPIRGLITSHQYEVRLVVRQLVLRINSRFSPHCKYYFGPVWRISSSLNTKFSSCKLGISEDELMVRQRLRKILLPETKTRRMVQNTNKNIILGSLQSLANILEHIHFRTGPTS